MNRHAGDPQHRTRRAVMAYLEMVGGPIRLIWIRRDVAKKYHVSKDAVHECVARLHREGLIERVSYGIYRRSDHR